MPNFDHIISIAGKYLYKYRYHYLYDDLRSEVMIYMATAKNTPTRHAVMLFTRMWIRDQTSNTVDIDTIDEAEHPQELPSNNDSQITQSEILSRYTARQQKIIKMLIDGCSFTKISQEMGITERTVQKEILKIKKTSGFCV